MATSGPDRHPDPDGLVLASTANERTQLAWNRTALSWAAAGAVVARYHAPGGLLDGQTFIGVVMMGCAGVMFLTGWWRYHRRDVALREGGRLPGAPTLLGFTSAVVVLTAAVALGLEFQAVVT